MWLRRRLCTPTAITLLLCERKRKAGAYNSGHAADDCCVSSVGSCPSRRSKVSGRVVWGQAMSKKGAHVPVKTRWR